MSDEQKTSAFKWAQFLVATILTLAMLYFHVYVKEVPLMLLGIPGALFGFGLKK